VCANELDFGGGRYAKANMGAARRLRWQWPSGRSGRSGRSLLFLFLCGVLLEGACHTLSAQKLPALRITTACSSHSSW